MGRSTPPPTQAEIARSVGVHESTIARRRARGAPLDAPPIRGNPNSIAARLATGRATAQGPEASPVPLTPGQEVAAARLAAGLSQAAMARLAGVCQSVLSKVERGMGSAGATQAVRRALGLPVE